MRIRRTRQATAAASGKEDDAKVSSKRTDTEADNGRNTKKGKAAEDAGKPKRPANAFFVFLKEFRKTNPKRKKARKAAGLKWKSMSEAEKAPYVAIFQSQKAGYYEHEAGSCGVEDEVSQTAVGHDEEGSDDAHAGVPVEHEVHNRSQTVVGDDEEESDSGVID